MRRRTLRMHFQQLMCMSVVCVCVLLLCCAREISNIFAGTLKNCMTCANFQYPTHCDSWANRLGKTSAKYRRGRQGVRHRRGGYV